MNEQAKNKAIDNVIEGNQDVYYLSYALALKWIDKRHLPFTVDDFKRYFYEMYPSVKVIEPRVFGGLFSNLAKEGKIKTTGKYIKSADTVCHNRPKAEWISLVYALKQQANAKKKQKTLSLF